MKHLKNLAVLTCAIAQLTACGGVGGSAGGPVLPQPTLSPTAAPTITVPVVTPTPTASAPSPAPTSPLVSPTPLPTATVAPAGAVGLTWSSAAILNGPLNGPIQLFFRGETATLFASEQGYSGTFSGTLSNCSSGAGATPPVAISQNASPANSFSLLAANASGSCNIIVSDSTGKTSTIQVITTISTGVVI